LSNFIIAEERDRERDREPESQREKEREREREHVVLPPDAGFKSKMLL
jgi:hypothetical protein